MVLDPCGFATTIHVHDGVELTAFPAPGHYLDVAETPDPGWFQLSANVSKRRWHDELIPTRLTYGLPNLGFEVIREGLHFLNRGHLGFIGVALLGVGRPFGTVALIIAALDVAFL
jgi:hypothetical protein